MRILLATYEYPPDLGGVAAYLGGLFSAVGDVRVARFRLPKFPLGWLAHLPKMFLSSRGADVVIVSHVLPLGTAAMLSGKPYAVIVHGLDLRSAAAHPRKKALAARVLYRAKLVVANSRATSRELAAFGMDPDAALVLTPGVDARFGEAGTSSAAPDRKVLLSVGRFVPRKGFDRLIRLLPQLRASCGEVDLVIAGAGPEEARLRKEAVLSGVAAHVTFVIAPDRAALAGLYRSAHAFALPVRASKDDLEGFGIVLLEAAVFGLPVVASRVGGIPEAVAEGETGLLVDPDSEGELFEALKRLLSDPEAMRRMGEAGRARVIRDFRWEDRARMLMTRLA